MHYFSFELFHSNTFDCNPSLGKWVRWTGREKLRETSCQSTPAWRIPRIRFADLIYIYSLWRHAISILEKLELSFTLFVMLSYRLDGASMLTGKMSRVTLRLNGWRWLQSCIGWNCSDMSCGMLTTKIDIWWNYWIAKDSFHVPQH